MDLTAFKKIVSPPLLFLGLSAFIVIRVVLECNLFLCTFFIVSCHGELTIRLCVFVSLFITMFCHYVLLLH
uniref:Uncharacterized protein n=1 Tax=Rhizophora mucronata TaxID=61149 RepID=A0A2P2LYA5_RHIMU